MDKGLDTFQVLYLGFSYFRSNIWVWGIVKSIISDICSVLDHRNIESMDICLDVASAFFMLSVAPERELITSLNNNMWIPDSKTDKLLKKSPGSDWIKNTYKPGPIKIQEGPGDHYDKILVWSGNFTHDYYGNDLPAIRVAGIVNMSAKALMDLLVDSSRVKEYNKLSLGREDLVVFQDNMLQAKMETKNRCVLDGHINRFF